MSQTMEAQTQQKTLKNPFGHKQSNNTSNRKTLSNPFHVNGGSYTQVESETLDQSPLQFGHTQNPYANNSNTYAEDDSNLEGIISLTPQEISHKRSSPQQERPNNGDFMGFEPTSQNFQPAFIKNNSVLNSVVGLFGFFGNGEQNKNDPQAAEYDEENEPPLLEDLGIDPKLIKMRTLSVLKFQQCQEEFVKEPDMSGPLFLVLVFGMLLLLSGKVHFGYIYGFGMMGTIGVYLMINMLSQNNRAQLYNTMSILGYCLLPIVLLSVFTVFFNLINFVGFILALGAVTWATLAAANFFQVLLQLNQQKWLVAYPLFLFYFVFVLITLF